MQAAEQQLANQRASLQDQLFQLTASAADKQQAILDKLADAESQRIQKQIWEAEARIQAEKEASDSAVRAAQEAADKKKQVESEAYNLETKRLQLLGDTKTLRERELALVDPANQAAQKQIWAIEDKIEADKIAAAAAEEAARAQAQAAEEAARAAQQIKDAWKSITDSIFEEVARIRGLVAGQGPSSLAKAQSAFDSATTRALNGDQEAAKSLPELSRALLDIAGEQARSMIELRRIQMLTAASLEATGTRINTNYGLAIPAYADGGNYNGGIALVGENGPELINFNSSGRVYDAKTTAGMMGSGSNLEALVEKLNANIEGLRYEVRAGVTHTSKVAKILERVTPDGDAIATRDVV
jgi:chemotaxis protein histidine kinase CheA